MEILSLKGTTRKESGRATPTRACILEIPALLRGPVGSTPRQACTIAITDSKEKVEEEEDEGEEVAIRDLLRGPAGSAPRLACTIAIQLRMYHNILVSLTCGADV